MPRKSEPPDFSMLVDALEAAHRRPKVEVQDGLLGI
jgi:hypothetical protein